MNKKMRIAAVAISVLMLFVIGAMAGDDGKQEIQATLLAASTIRSKGVALDLKNDAGMQRYPILYDGELYLPAQALCGALDVAVDWDLNTGVVSLDDSVDIGLVTKGPGLGLSAAVDYPVLVVGVSDSNQTEIGLTKTQVLTSDTAYDDTPILVTVGDGRQSQYVLCTVTNYCAEPVDVVISNYDTGAALKTLTVGEYNASQTWLSTEGVNKLMIQKLPPKDMTVDVEGTE